MCFPIPLPSISPGKLGEGSYINSRGYSSYFLGIKTRFWHLLDYSASKGPQWELCGTYYGIDLKKKTGDECCFRIATSQGEQHFKKSCPPLNANQPPTTPSPFKTPAAIIVTCRYFRFGSNALIILMQRREGSVSSIEYHMKGQVADICSRSLEQRSPVMGAKKPFVCALGYRHPQKQDPGVFCKIRSSKFGSISLKKHFKAQSLIIKIIW